MILVREREGEFVRADAIKRYRGDMVYIRVL